MKTILVFGNEFVESDSLAKKVADSLKVEGFDFRKCDRIEDLMAFREGHPTEEIVILDVVKGIREPIVIEDASQLKARGSVTLHDLDLSFFLQLLTVTGQLGKLRIIGLPMQGDIEKLKNKVAGLLTATRPRGSA